MKQRQKSEMAAFNNRGRAGDTQVDRIAALENATVYLLGKLNSSNYYMGVAKGLSLKAIRDGAGSESADEQLLAAAAVTAKEGPDGEEN